MLHQNLREYLARHDVSPVERVPVYFIDGTESKEVYHMGQVLAHKLGVKYWSVSEMECQKETGEEVVERLATKLEQYNYKGSYLISGFPKNKDDVQTLRNRLGAVVNIGAYAGCLHTPVTQT